MAMGVMDLNSGYRSEVDVNSSNGSEVDLNSGYRNEVDLNSGYVCEVDLRSGYRSEWNQLGCFIWKTWPSISINQLCHYIYVEVIHCIDNSVMSYCFFAYHTILPPNIIH